MQFKEFVLLREHGIMINEMPHVELFKTKDDYFVVDFRSEDGLSWINNVIRIFNKGMTVDLDGKQIKLPKSKMREIEDSLASNVFFLNILKHDIKSIKNKTEVVNKLPLKIKRKLGVL